MRTARRRIVRRKSISSGKYGSSRRHEYSFRPDHVKSRVQESYEDDFSASDGDRSPRMISGVTSPSTSVLTLDSATTLSAGSPTSNTPRKFFTMGSENLGESPRTSRSHAEITGEDIDTNQGLMQPVPTGNHLIRTYNATTTPRAQTAPPLHSEDDYLYRGDIPLRNEDPNEKGRRHLARLEAMEAKLRQLRWSILETRTLVHERRRELRELRLEMVAADQKYMKLVREGMLRKRQGVIGEGLAESSVFYDVAALESSYTQLQATRDKYGPLEEAYDFLEAHLDSQEFKMTELEDKISGYGVFLREKPGSESDRFSSSSDEEELDNDEISAHTHPLYVEFLSKLGDADLLQEAHAELVYEKTRLQEQQDIRRRIGRTLLPEDQATLESFPVEEAKIRDEIDKVNADIDRLRLQCIQEGLINDNMQDSLLISDGSLQDEAKEDILGSPKDIGEISPEQSEYSRYPQLLEKPVEIPVEFADLSDLSKSKSLISEFKIGDIGDRITCWLLHKLRSSCLEVELFVRLSTSAFDTYNGVALDPGKDLEKWQEGVLEFWFGDSANLPPAAYEYETTATISTVTTGTATATATKPLVPIATADPRVLLPLAIPLPTSPLPSAVAPPSPQPSPLLSPPLPSPLPLPSPILPSSASLSPFLSSKTGDLVACSSPNSKPLDDPGGRLTGEPRLGSQEKRTLDLLDLASAHGIELQVWSSSLSNRDKRQESRLALETQRNKIRGRRATSL